MTDRTKAMDALIAGDADLYDVPLTQKLTDMSVHAAEMAILYRRGGCELDATALRSFSEAMGEAADAIASARIKGDKDRATQSSAPTEPEYDHTQDGTANFERALSYARSLEADADFSNSQYAFFMAERGDQLRTLTELAHQYLSDLRYPPSPDSKERRIEWIKAVIAKVTDRPEGDDAPNPHQGGHNEGTH